MYKYAILALLLLIMTPFAIAQETLSETFTSPDSGLTVQYPDGWTAEIIEDGVVTLSLLRARRLRSSIQIFPPALVAVIGYGEETDPAALAESVGIALASDDTGELNQVAIGDADGATYAYTNNAGENAMLVALPFMDALAMLSITTVDDNLSDLEQTAIAVAASLSQPAPAPQSLENYNATWQEAVAELESLGLIAAGGELIFRENRAFFSGQGSWFTPLAERAPRTDVVMAGDLRYTASGDDGLFETENCALMSRIVTEGNTAVQYLDVGVDSDGEVYYFDRFGSGFNVHSGYQSLPDFDFSESHHFLVLALDDRLTVFVDGEMVFENRQIDERSGSYGITLIGYGPAAFCEATNIWAYEAPTFQPGVCEISAGGSVNMRSGPGTTFEVAGQLAANTVRNAQGQAVGTDGFIWWQLDDDSWVRDDVVRAQGDCKSIPEVATE